MLRSRDLPTIQILEKWCTAMLGAFVVVEFSGEPAHAFPQLLGRHVAGAGDSHQTACRGPSGWAAGCGWL